MVYFLLACTPEAKEATLAEEPFLSEAISSVDTDGTGQLNFQEFLILMRCRREATVT